MTVALRQHVTEMGVDRRARAELLAIERQERAQAVRNRPRAGILRKPLLVCERRGKRWERPSRKIQAGSIARRGRHDDIEYRELAAQLPGHVTGVDVSHPEVANQIWQHIVHGLGVVGQRAEIGIFALEEPVDAAPWLLEHSTVNQRTRTPLPVHIAEPRTWALGSGGTGAFTPDSERPLRPCNHRANCTSKARGNVESP